MLPPLSPCGWSPPCESVPSPGRSLSACAWLGHDAATKPRPVGSAAAPTSCGEMPLCLAGGSARCATACVRKDFGLKTCAASGIAGLVSTFSQTTQRDNFAGPSFSSGTPAAAGTRCTPQQLQRLGIPVSLICLDVAMPYEVAPNVRHAAHLYRSRRRIYPARPLRVAPGSTAQVENLDLDAEGLPDLTVLALPPEYHKQPIGTGLGCWACDASCP